MINTTSSLAPICLFAYARLRELKLVVDALKLNDLASRSRLIIISDGPKTKEVESDVYAVRNYLKTITGFDSINIIESSSNKGLASSIVEGVSSVLEKYGKVIVVEDDVVVSSRFLEYMNSALSYYEFDEKVFQVSGFMFPIKGDCLPDVFFYQANSCWGWATWSRAWKYYSDDACDLLEQIRTIPYGFEKLNAMQATQYEMQLKLNAAGLLKTWAVKWQATLVLKDALVLHPRMSLVKNIGFSGNGENCRKGVSIGTANENVILDVTVARITSSDSSIALLKRYFAFRYSLIGRIYFRIKGLFV